MASTLNFPTETNYITIFDVNSVYSSKLKESLARTKFWKHFSGFHVEGCTEFIRFFEPKLKICDSLLDELQEYEDENWIKSVRKQLDKEFHILNLMKAFNTNYGLLYTKIKGYESKTRYSTEQFEKLLLEEKELQDEVVKYQLNQRADEEELEEQITKVANLCDDYPTSHGYIAPKAKKAGKMANKYTENLKELEEKTAKLIQKSDEVSKRCEKLKREKIKELAKIWKETLTKLERDFRDFRKETLHVKGTHTGLQFAKEIDQESLTATSMKNHEKSFRIPKYQKSSQILDGNKICKNCFKRNNIVLTDEQPEANTTSSNEVHESKKKKAVKSNGARNEDDSAVDKENTSNWKKTPPPIPQRPRLQKPGASNEKAAKNNESSIKTPLPKTSNTKELEEVKPVKTTASEKLKNKRQDKDDAMEAMPSKVTKVNRQEKEEPVKLTTSKLTKEMKVEQKEVSGEAVQTTEAQPKSSQTNNDDEKPSTSQSNRKSSTKPVYTKREKLYTQHTPQKKEKRPPFTPYKVTIIRTHKKEAPNEMSVTLGESVKIISAQDDVDYVMATKKLKFFRKKTGLIPIYTF